ncbi:hypothetical protein PVAND_013371 [Polypedilum vanderplanki]|uniref:Uncharacterized protein n=1 Tax=Polypedilum vanderplanki TaxID=319348 RepID=A0A9J6CPA2_POLVA|nr:hypothetical protein PVAND_013371 [Polypedilum vanderplanki]
MLKKLFLVCGIGSFENNWNSLHGPLKNLLTCENQDTWVEENQNIFLNEKQILIDEDAYFYPIQDTTSPSTSFYKCLHKKKNSQVDFDTWIELYVIKVENEINTKWNITLDSHDKKLMKSGQLIEGFIDIYIISSMENMIIKITKVNSHCEVLEELIFGSNDKDEMELVSLDDYFILKLQD